MAYVRFSMVRPRRGEEKRVLEIMHQLAEAAVKHPGCTASHVLRARDSSGEILRLTYYDNDLSAQHAANDAHIMALRSELHIAVESGHEERGFDVE